MLKRLLEGLAILLPAHRSEIATRCWFHCRSFNDESLPHINIKSYPEFNKQ